MSNPLKRPDHNGTQRSQYESNKKRILATQNICGICGKEVDKKIKWPHPLSPAIDHIIPVSKGGHPSDISNLQLAHMRCNREKADKYMELPEFGAGTETIDNRILPLTFDWSE